MAEHSVFEGARLTGAVQGKITFDANVIAHARAASAHQYQAASEEEFSGDAVETYALPAWLPPVDSWLPHADLLSLGLVRNPTDEPQMVGTCGIDPHSDCIHGLVFVVVLHNDQLKFKQGRQMHETVIGEWFIFDDRLDHEVRDTKQSTCYLCITVPLRSTA